MADQDKGKFSANIGQDVIEEALRSVERRTSSGAPESADASPPQGDPGSGEAATAEGAEVELDPGAPAEAPSAEQAEIAELKAQLEFSLAKGRELMEKVKSEHERVLRATADLDNYRKRAVKEKEEVQKFGVERMLKDFLPVGDNFDRALEHAKSAADFESLVQGIKMTRKLFDDALSKHGVKSFSAKGQPFDPRLHEAMQQVETTELPPNHVYAEVLRGYLLQERLMRPALVMVTKAPEKPVAAAEAEKISGEGGGGDGTGGEP
ncbi:MAG: nucleotide exchange factor GrpE [Myxococcota bacterium]|nr:nucleotide exchange factor GrpE [Myxococcota bacterium]